MKRSIAAILLVLYVTLSCGVVISYHYCMDTYDSLQLGDKRSDTCGVCGMHTGESNGCCNDEVKIFKIQDDQQVSIISFRFTTPDAVVPEFPTLDDASLINSSHQLYLNNHSPPLSKQDTYLKNCVFRI